tara:strand:- start:118 stop:951 length:834 start_codon:yes stop_codon:yes gene_type:complete
MTGFIHNNVLAGASGNQGVDFADNNLYDVLGNIGYQDNLSMCWDLRAVTACLPGDGTVVDLAGVTDVYNYGSITLTDNGEFNAESFLTNPSSGNILVYSTTQTAWMRAMANDGAEYTLMFVYESNGVTGEDYIMATNDGQVGANGFHIRGDHVSFQRTEKQAHDAGDAPGVLVSVGPSVNFTRNTWSFGLLSFKELGGAVSFWNINGANQPAVDGAFDASATNAADYPLTFFGKGDGAAPMNADTKLGQVAIWSTNLDTDAADAIYEALDPTYNFGA